MKKHPFIAFINDRGCLLYLHLLYVSQISQLFYENLKTSNLTTKDKHCKFLWLTE